MWHHQIHFGAYSAGNSTVWDLNFEFSRPSVGVWPIMNAIYPRPSVGVWPIMNAIYPRPSVGVWPIMNAIYVPRPSVGVWPNYEIYTPYCECAVDWNHFKVFLWCYLTLITDPVRQHLSTQTLFYPEILLYTTPINSIIHNCDCSIYNDVKAKDLWWCAM